MKKRILSVTVILCILSAMLAAFPLAVNAGTRWCGKNLTWTLDNTFTLTISGTGDMTNYTDDDPAPWFSNSSEIKSIIIENGVTSIGDYAFEDCSFLTSVTIPNSVKSIGDYAFNYCLSITSITIPNGVTSIGDRAFSICRSLTSITISDSVTSIGDGAFKGCNSLASITIPDSVTSIGSCAFAYCNSLTSIIVDNNNPSYSLLDGNLYNKDKTVLIQYAVGQTNTIFAIPDSVTSIGDGAFSSCKSLTSIMIPKSVTSIGDGAFAFCISLAYIMIPDGVTSICDSAFAFCTSLTSITIPDSVTNIEDWAFDNCESLTTVYYNGSSADWDKIQIGDYNSYLTNATIRYTNNAPYTVTTVSFKDGQKMFTISPAGIETNDRVILALYDGDMLADIKYALYNGKEIIFTSDKEYTTAKVMVWSGSGKFQPVCEVEPVS